MGRTQTQPIAIEDLTAYLLAGLDTDLTESRVVEIGGADVAFYETLMREYARRGGRDPHRLTVGDAVDFWRVEAVRPRYLLRLAAEMRLPGRAWLVFEVAPDGPGAVIRQTAVFDPVGLAGLAYWYALLPLHRLLFARMLRGIVEQVRRRPAARGAR